ncbi:MAG: IS66 family transposase zinc-finger binding domain-containing protein [Pseudomonadota bacterium]
MNDAAKKAPDLPDDSDALKAIVGDLEATIGVQKLEIERLQEQLRLARHKRFGASSEKTPADQLGLFNEAEVASTAPDDGSDDTEITVPKHKRTKGGRKRLPDHLPRVRIENDIPEADKICPCGSGKQRQKIGEVISEQADIVPAKVRVLQHVRHKYGHCQDCDGVFPSPENETNDNTGAAPKASAETLPATKPVGEPRAVIVAPFAAQPIPKSIASPGTCAFVTIAKYVDGRAPRRRNGVRSTPCSSAA